MLSCFSFVASVFPSLRTEKAFSPEPLQPGGTLISHPPEFPAAIASGGRGGCRCVPAFLSGQKPYHRPQ